LKNVGCKPACLYTDVKLGQRQGSNWSKTLQGGGTGEEKWQEVRGKAPGLKRTSTATLGKLSVRENRDDGFKGGANRGSSSAPDYCVFCQNRPGEKEPFRQMARPKRWEHSKKRPVGTQENKGNPCLPGPLIGKTRAVISEPLVPLQRKTKSGGKRKSGGGMMRQPSLPAFILLAPQKKKKRVWKTQKKKQGFR